MRESELRNANKFPKLNISTRTEPEQEAVNMKYEKTRKEFYQQKIIEISGQLAEILDSGRSVEIAKSRSGLKIFSVSKKYQIVRK